MCEGERKMKDALMYILIKLTYVHVWIIIFAVLLVIAMIYFVIHAPKEEREGSESVITSDDLLKDVNKEREAQGLHEIPAVNSRSGGNTFARLDKSFSSVPDFFMKLFGKGKK